MFMMFKSLQSIAVFISSLYCIGETQVRGKSGSYHLLHNDDDDVWMIKVRPIVLCGPEMCNRYSIKCNFKLSTNHDHLV